MYPTHLEEREIGSVFIYWLRWFIGYVGSSKMAPVELEVLGGVAVVTLNRPEKLNSITNEDVFQIGTYLEDIAKLDDVFVTVLIGTGRFFSS